MRICGAADYQLLLLRHRHADPRGAARLQPLDQEIRSYITADSLDYLSWDGLYSFLDGPREGFCDACFTGNYPVEIPANQDRISCGCSKPATTHSAADARLPRTKTHPALALWGGFALCVSLGVSTMVARALCYLAFCILLLTATGCDPVVSIAGANFPDWLLCASAAAILAALCHPLFVASGLGRSASAAAFLWRFDRDVRADRMVVFFSRA